MANPWLQRRVLNYAHQGGALEAPSSTLHALRRALTVGATALELDCHLTRDGEVVVAHDATVDRMTEGSGSITALTLGELRALDAAYRFEEIDSPGLYPLRGQGLGMPTVREVLAAFPRTFLNFDIKAESGDPEGCAHGLATLLQEFGRRDDVIVASFDDALTARFSTFAPEVGISVGTELAMEIYQAVQSGEPLPPLRHVAMQLPAAFGDLPVVDEKLVERAHAAGVAVHVWTVNDAATMERLLDAGVDGLITDRPSVCAGVLARRGAGFHLQS
jgi:glycerophosphoryl diester phosphodiesterase